MSRCSLRLAQALGQNWHALRACASSSAVKLELQSLRQEKHWFGHQIKHPRCFGYVYLWYDTLNRKLCIGSHHRGKHEEHAFDSPYFTSTGYCRSAIKKRPEDFRFRVLQYNLLDDDRRVTQDMEQHWLDKIPVGQIGKRYHNQTRVAGGGASCDPAVAQQISVAMRMRIADGSHNFFGESNPTHRRIADGSHNFLGESNPNHQRIADGSHICLKCNPSLDPLKLARRAVTCRGRNAMKYKQAWLDKLETRPEAAAVANELLRLCTEWGRHAASTAVHAEALQARIKDQKSHIGLIREFVEVGEAAVRQQVLYASSEIDVGGAWGHRKAGVKACIKAGQVGAAEWCLMVISDTLQDYVG